MFGFLKALKNKRDGDRCISLYERAVSMANMYIPVKLGPGNAKLASAILNDILTEDVLKGNGVEEFRVENAAHVTSRAAEVLASEPDLLELMAHTLWIKWSMDKAFGRSEAVAKLEGGWVFKAFADRYPLLPLPAYEALVLRFETLTKMELGKYLERTATAPQGQGS